MEYYSAIKRMKHCICSNVDRPREYILSEVSQTDKYKHYMISLICEI